MSHHAGGGQGQYVIMLRCQVQYLSILRGQGQYVIMSSYQGQAPQLIFIKVLIEKHIDFLPLELWKLHRSFL